MGCIEITYLKESPKTNISLIETWDVLKFVIRIYTKRFQTCLIETWDVLKSEAIE